MTAPWTFSPPLSVSPPMVRRMARFFGRRREPEVPRNRTSDRLPVVEDLRVAACPYCGVELAKVPARATRCPSCGETMFVRTDQRYRTRLVVTQDQADEIDDAGEALAAGELAAYTARVASVRHDLVRTGKFTASPTYQDVRWRMLNEDALGALAKGDSMSLLFTRRKMVEVLRRRRDGAALELALEVFYLELCGEPTYAFRPDEPDPEGIEWLPLVTPSPGLLTESVGRDYEERGVSVIDAAKDFHGKADSLRNGLNLPLTWSETWPRCV